MTTNAEQIAHPVVEVQCRNGHRRVIHPGEIGPYEVPMCVECPRIMFAKSAHDCACSWVSPEDRSEK